MAKNNLTLTVSAKDLASGTLRRVSVGAIALGTAIGNLASRLAVGAMNGLRGWIGEALACEKANVMLDASLRGVGAYTPQLAQQFRELAAAVQDETGASDENVKAIIAQLTALGLAPSKMGDAVRATKALEAVGMGGSQAMRALARAMEGDIKGFERLSPAVRLAATEEEKYAALNSVLSAGYEQQKANLQTVGGAWEALRGRLSDAREAIIGAVFEGAKIGSTFNDAQAAVGRFLESDTFTAFTDKLRSGAAYVRQIVEAMGTDGGAAEVGGAIGSVILAAIQDGARFFAKVAGDALDKATGGLRSGWRNVRQSVGNFGAGVGSLLAGGTYREGADFAAANQEYAQPDMTRGESQLDAALAKLRAVVTKRAAQHKAAADAAKAGRAAEDAVAQPVVDMSAALAKRAKAEQEAADEATRRAGVEGQIEAFQIEIRDAAAQEASARKKLAALETQRAGAAGQNINQWIANLQGRREEKLQNARDMEKAERRAADLRERSARGTKLSPRSRQWLEDFDRNRALAGGQKRIQNAADAARELREKQEQYQKRVEELQKELVAEAKRTRELLEENLEVP